MPISQFDRSFRHGFDAFSRNSHGLQRDPASSLDQLTSSSFSKRDEKYLANSSERTSSHISLHNRSTTTTLSDQEYSSDDDDDCCSFADYDMCCTHCLDDETAPTLDDMMSESLFDFSDDEEEEVIRSRQDERLGIAGSVTGQPTNMNTYGRIMSTKPLHCSDKPWQDARTIRFDRLRKAQQMLSSREAVANMKR